jgi:hypothetical protein
MMRGTTFQARFHVVFQIAHDELRHRQLLMYDIMISNLTMAASSIMRGKLAASCA